MLSLFFAFIQSESIVLQPNGYKEFNEAGSCIYVAINARDVTGTAYTKSGTNSYEVFGNLYKVVNFSSSGGKLVVKNPSSSPVTFYYHRISFTGSETSATACNTYDFYIDPSVSDSFVVANSTLARSVGMFSHTTFCYFYLAPCSFTVSFIDKGPSNSKLYVNDKTGRSTEQTTTAQHAVSIRWSATNIKPSGYASAKITSKASYDTHVTIDNGLIYTSKYLCLGSTSSISCNTQNSFDYISIDDIVKGLSSLVISLIIIACVVVVTIIICSICICCGCCCFRSRMERYSASVCSQLL